MISATIILLDGPMGTELEARGVGTELPLWSAHALDRAPSVVTSIHRAYADAGATIHTTNTFRTKRRDVGERWRELTERAVALTRGAVPSGHRVAGSMSPLADCYRPDLSPPSSVAAREHAEMAAALAAAGCDLLLCETFPHEEEALIAAAAAVSTGIETWLSVSAGPDANLLTPEQVRVVGMRAVDHGVRAVLINCVPAAETLRFVEPLAHVGLPFGAYANAGRPDDLIGWESLPTDGGAARYAEYARTWVRAGATIIGGCCGTSPAHLRVVRDVLTPRS
jgi:S-methylmethionine-dependent homocysteine/selenocysteine methylase